jgi:hypothetical protein
MAKTSAAQVTQNEPTQASIDAVCLGMIRLARKAKDEKMGALRSAYSTGNLRGLNTDAAKDAIRLIEKGGDAIDTFFATFKKTAEYVQLMGKVLSPSQYELFGSPKQGPTPEDERAAIEGRAVGFMMDDEDGSQEAANPYPGTPKGNSWVTAFRQARAERNTVLSMKAPEAEASDGAAETAGATGDEGKA